MIYSFEFWKDAFRFQFEAPTEVDVCQQYQQWLRLCISIIVEGVDNINKKLL